MAQLTHNQILILESITKEVISEGNKNEFLVQIIEHAGGFLNAMTRSAYEKSKGVSYNTAKKYRENRKILGVNFVIDND